MNSDSIASTWEPFKAERARTLSQKFLRSDPSKRLVFGRNIYAKAIAARLEVGAFIDDFTDEKEFLGKPVVRTNDVPCDAIVLATSGGRPLTVRQILNEKGITQIDYFSFLKWSDLDLPEAVFNEGFTQSFNANKDQIDWLFRTLTDDRSRLTLKKLLDFRNTYDLDCLNGFEERQALQYFEPFIDWGIDNPVFVDVGGFDGANSETFIERSPHYKKIYLFEPEPANFTKCKARLAPHHNIEFLSCGVGSKNEKLRFSSNGSASVIDHCGNQEITLKRIDDVLIDAPTFLKMDIEGAELDAIEGARNSISTHKPALAICVYHRPTDFWEVPRKILSFHKDYEVRLEHYTESIYETVMYFIPHKAIR